MSLHRGIAFILSLLLTVQGFGQIRSFGQVDVNELRDFLLAPVPSRFGATDFFESLSRDGEKARSVSDLVKSDQILESAAEEGRKFREFYYNALASEFGAPGSEFFLTPEKVILKWILHAPRDHTTSMNRTLPEARAAQFALTDTLARFNLPAQITSNDIESGRHHIPEYGAAFDFYRRRFNALTQQDETISKQERAPVAETKRQIIENLNHLRAQNAMSAFTQAVDARLPIYDFQTKKTKEVKVREFKVSNVTFTTFAQNVSTHSVSVPEVVDLTKLYYYLKARFSSNWPVVKNTNQNPKVDLQVDKYQVVLETDLHGKMVVNEMSFSNMLKSLVPPRPWYDRSANWRDRFIVEAAHRDALIADTLSFLEEYTDVSESALQARLASRMKLFDYGFKCPTCSLTEEARLRDGPVMENSKALDLRWFGYSIHADFWRARDQAALDLKQPSIFDSARQTKPESPEAKQAKELARSREADRASKLSKFVNRALILGTIATFLLSVGGGMVIAKAGSKVKEAINNSVQANNSGGGEQSGAKSDGGPPPSINPGQTPEAQNNPAGGEDRAEDVIVYRIKNTALGDSELPRYFNIPRVADFYASRFSDGGQTPWGVFEFTSEIGKEKGDFDLEAVLPHNPDTGRLPIAYPEGFRLVDIQVYRGKTQLIFDKDFWIQTDTRTGLINLVLLNNIGSDYTYTASYKKEHRNKAKASDFLVDPARVMRVAKTIRERGGVELANALEGSLQAPRYSNAVEIAQTIALTGMYTYDKEKSVRENPMVPFTKYDKFLRDDGKYWYQCTGSNLMTRDILNTVIADVDVAVVPTLGYVRKPGSTEITGVGHLHNMLTKQSQPFMFMSVDGTPKKMDPKYKKHPFAREKTKEEKQREKEKRERALADLIRQNQRNAVLPDPIREKEGGGVESLPTRPKKIPPPDLAQIHAENLKQLELARARILRSINRLTESSPILSNVNGALRLPGVRMLAVSKVVQEYAQGTITLEQGVQNLILLSMNISPFARPGEGEKQRALEQLKILKSEQADDAKIFLALLEKEAVGLAASVQAEIQKADKIATAKGPYAYLRDAEMQGALNALSALLKTKDWKRPQPVGLSCRALIAKSV